VRLVGHLVVTEFRSYGARNLSTSTSINIPSLTGLRNAAIEITNGRLTTHVTQTRALLKTLFHECKLLMKKGMVKRRWEVHFAGSLSKTKRCDRR